MTETKKKRISLFWLCFVVFILVLISFWIYILAYVNRCLETYEAAQPEYVIEKIVKEIENGQAEQIFTFTSSSSRFEDADIAKENFLAHLDGKELTFEQNAASYNAAAPSYFLYADGSRIAALTLRETDSYPLMFILSVQSFELEEATPLLDTPDLAVTIRVPDTYSVYINGILADQRERTENTWEIPELQYAAEYVSVPQMAEYRITGLFSFPDVAVKDPYGNVASYTQSDNLVEVSSFAHCEMDSDLSAMVLKNAKDYSNFFSKDLEGCRTSTKCISHLFPKDSYYLELAENYRLHDMWMYSSHQTPTFSEEQVTEYVKYSEDFFSCRVSFQKHMQLTRTGELRTDVNDTYYYYVKIGDNYVIADMKAAVE